jgi:hypothetical protein
MMAGHFTTALIAHQRLPKGTLLYLLLISQLQDLLWFVFHYLGLEETKPSDAFDATLNNMNVNMLYSHDLLPQFCWLVLIYIVGRTLFKSNKVALFSVAILIGHFILDFFSGHMHHVFGEDSMQTGLGLYASDPYLAIVIEAVFTTVALWYFFKVDAAKGYKRTLANKASIIGVFAYGIIFMLLIATHSFRDILKIPQFDLGFNTNVPTLIFTYLSMALLLHYFVSQSKEMPSTE